MDRFLLDTNILLGLVRSAPWALSTDEKHALSADNVLSCTSVVCQGELLALAEKFGWGQSKRTRLDEILFRLPVVEINQPAILRAYALIDAWTHGTAVDAPGATPPPKPARPMQQNDLWIAATAHASGFVLLSTDTDFHHLDGVWLALERVRQDGPPD